MSYWIQEVSKYRNVLYMCDKAADVAKLPKVGVWGDQTDVDAPATPCCYGSRATVIEDGTNWILSKDSNSWVQVSSDSGVSQSLEDLVGAVKGKSAYEIWESQPDNTGKTEQEFLQSLIGPTGAPGKAGENGKSAYEIWEAKEENDGKTEDDFLAALKGEPGEAGSPGAKGDPGAGVAVGGTAGQFLSKKSETDYDTEWVDAPTPTVDTIQASQVLFEDGQTFQDKLDAGTLKGADGTPGTAGTNGKDGASVTAIELVKDETGQIVSGKATVGETQIDITITVQEPSA